jgi:prolyl oligopeptidase
MNIEGNNRISRSSLRLAWFLAIAALAPNCLPAAAAGLPDTPRSAVVDTYHGVTVQDPYRWLENAADPKVHAWSLAQDERTRAYLDGLPYRKPVYERLMAQISASSNRFYELHFSGGQIFAMLNAPPRQQPMLAVLGSDADPSKARIVLDPNAMNPAGTTAIDWYVPSPDAKLVAVSLSENGSEDGSLHIFDAASGAPVGEVIDRVQYPTAGGGVAWREDGKGFWYTRYPGSDRPAEEQHFYQRVYYHRIGEDPAKDALVLGKDFPKIAEIFLEPARGAKGVLASVQNGDGGQFAHYLIDADNRVRQLTRFEDGVVAVVVGPDGAAYLVSRKDAPRGKLLKLDLKQGGLDKARLLVPQSDAVIPPLGEFDGEPLVVTRDSIYIRQQVGGPERVAAFDLEGHSKAILPLPQVATIEELVLAGDGTLLVGVATYLRPPYFLRYTEADGKLAETALAQTSPVTFDDAEVVREFARSRDGTLVPMNIVRRKGTRLEGANPVLLTGYGGYSVSLTPSFLGATARLWLDAGGVFVIANLRGGGEFGEQWHSQGALTQKQNVFDDLIGAAEHLIAHHYTTPGHLAIRGRSNGGLLMGAVLTQRPDLFCAVVSEVGIYDMLRVELDPNGNFNTTEYGTVRNADQFKALYAYSPYHHVVDGTRYPPVFMATGETDGRVNPAHSRKMIARLQAAAPASPVYLSINAHAGHGIGSALSIRVGQEADVYAFLFDQLGMTPPVK